MSVMFTSTTLPLARSVATIIVARLEGGELTPLPNIVCVETRRTDGHEPSSARFRYQLADQVLPPFFPQRIEDVTGFDKSGPYIIANDDRLVVIRVRTDGTFSYLFDGYAQVPQSDITPTSEGVSFQALGVEVREWDLPLSGSVHRGEEDPEVVDSDFDTEMPIRFNPDGRPNCTPDGWNSGPDDQSYPVFLMEYLIRDPAVTTTWTISKSSRYIMGTGNPDQTYTKLPPNFDALDNILCAIVSAIDGAAAFDPSDLGETEAQQIPTQDIDVQGSPWPVALANLIEPHGLDFRWVLTSGDDGLPQTTLEFFRLDNADKIKPKVLKLQAVGATLDPGSTNLGDCSIARDSAGIANEIVLDTQLRRWEAGFILAPAFQPDPADNGTRTNFELGNPACTGDNYIKYREWICAEGGDKFWDFPTSAFITGTATSLDDIFGEPIPDPLTGELRPQYVKRRRKPLQSVFTKDQAGRPLKAKLFMSSDYDGAQPRVWNFNGHWQEVATSTWNLLPDQIGIRFISPKPWDIQIGPQLAAGADPSLRKSGKIDLICSMNATIPPAAATTPSQTENPRVCFLLCCVIEDDKTPDIVASRRTSSESQFTIQRRVATRDRFFEHHVHGTSMLNDSSDDIVTDDSNVDDAQAFADAMRYAHENSKFAGQCTIPRITSAYGVGDKISMIKGRDIDLRTNGGSGDGEAAQYPVVTSVTMIFEGDQKTILTLGDRRGDPATWHKRGHDLSA